MKLLLADTESTGTAEHAGVDPAHGVGLGFGLTCVFLFHVVDENTSIFEFRVAVLCCLVEDFLRTLAEATAENRRIKQVNVMPRHS